MPDRQYAKYVQPLRLGTELINPSFRGKISDFALVHDQKTTPESPIRTETFHAYASGAGALAPSKLTPIIDGRCDYTKGNRFLFDRELSVMPKHRLAGNFVLTFLTKLASGYWNVFDPQNGYLAIHAAALRLLDLERISKRYFFENDMLINLNIFNVRVMDIALPARYGRERSSMSVGRILCSFPLHLFRGYWYRFYRKHVLRDFSPVALFMLTGLPLFAFGTCFGAYTWLQSYLHNQFASTGTVMLSVLPFIVGFELILQALVLEIRETLQSQPSAALRLPPGSSSNVRPSSPSG